MKYFFKNKHILSNTVFLTVLLFVVYNFTFILPHDLHCNIKENKTGLGQHHDFCNDGLDNYSHLFNLCSKNINYQNNDNLLDNHCFDNCENNEAEDENQKNDNCQICSLSYFNSLEFCDNLTFDFELQLLNEKPSYQKTKGFSSCSFFKFFLRSPPSYIA